VFDRIQGRAARQSGAGPAVASRFDGWLTPIQVEGDGQRWLHGLRRLEAVLAGGAAS
jgi:hypothetical protein